MISILTITAILALLAGVACSLAHGNHLEPVNAYTAIKPWSVHQANRAAYRANPEVLS